MPIEGSEYLRFEQDVPVYNFETEEYHNYFVGLVGLLVHNKCEPLTAEELDDFANKFADAVDTNEPWEWKNITGGKELSKAQKDAIKALAKEKGRIPELITKPETNHPDFDVMGTIYPS